MMVNEKWLLMLALGAFLVNFAQSQSMVCPAVRTTSGWLDLFPLPCTKNSDCTLMGNRHICCKGFCTKGKSAPVRADQQSKSSVVSSTTTSSSTTTTTTTSTTTTKKPSTTSSSTTTARQNLGLEEALRPFLQILPLQTTTTSAPKTTKAPAKPTNGKLQKFVCPKPGQAPVILFPIPCDKTSQCKAGGADQVCCDRRCLKGVAPPKPKRPAATHQPLLGVIPRECPAAPLGELLFEVQPCKSDADCWPRLCCPDGDKSYCRTAKARLDLVPIASPINGPVRMLEKYLQCTPPPQYDLFPKKCNSSVDCFPNLCCAEGGKKHCRPPQRSLLALLAGVTQRVGSTVRNLRQISWAQNNN